MYSILRGIGLLLHNIVIFKSHPYYCLYQYFAWFYCWAAFHWIDVPQFVFLSPAGGHLGCFLFWAIIHKVAMDILVQVFTWTLRFYFSWVDIHVSTQYVAGLYYKFMLNLWRNGQTVFQKQLYHLIFPPVVYESSDSSASSSLPGIVNLFNLSHSAECIVTPNVVLIHNSLMINDAEHLFLCFGGPSYPLYLFICSLMKIDSLLFDP